MLLLEELHETHDASDGPSLIKYRQGSSMISKTEQVFFEQITTHT
jgi:hypothetical protein